MRIYMQPGTNENDDENLTSFLKNLPISDCKAVYRSRRRDVQNWQVFLNGLLASISASVGAYIACSIFAQQQARDLQSIVIGFLGATIATVLAGFIGQAIVLFWCIGFGDSMLTAVSSYLATGGNYMLAGIDDPAGKIGEDRGNVAILGPLGAAIASIVAASMAVPIGASVGQRAKAANPVDNMDWAFVGAVVGVLILFSIALLIGSVRWLKNRSRLQQSAK